MITIDKLKKNFGEKIAVDIEHYEINQGDMLGLVGNNGAVNAGSAESGQWESSYK